MEVNGTLKEEVVYLGLDKRLKDFQNDSMDYIAHSKQE